MSAPTVLLAYLSPETVLPLTSIVAAIAGGSMFLTRRSIRFVVRCFRGVTSRQKRIAPATELARRLAARDDLQGDGEVSGASTPEHVIDLWDRWLLSLRRRRFRRSSNPKSKPGRSASRHDAQPPG